MLVASRQLLYWQRLMMSENSIVMAVCLSEAGHRGVLAKTHLSIRQNYGLLALDMLGASRADVHNVFASHLERFVRDRLLLEETLPG